MTRLLLRVLDHLEEILIGLLMATATAIIFLAVCHRYGITLSINLANWGRAQGYDWLLQGGKAVFVYLKSWSFTWAQELTIYMFVWMAKFGAAYGVRTGIHVGVDVALNQLGRASRNRVILFGLMCGALFTSIVGTLGARFVWRMAQTEQTSPDMELPMWLVYIAVPIGSYLMCFRFLQVAWVFWRTGDLPHHDHGHVEGIEDDTPLVPGVVGIDTHHHAPAPGGAR
jgi:TRAP-type C4-dicarboxylate transport system permease small subunit